MLNALEYSAELNSLAFYLDTSSRVSDKSLHAAFPLLGVYEFDYMLLSADRKAAAADLLSIYVEAEGIFSAFLVDYLDGLKLSLSALSARAVSVVAVGEVRTKKYDKNKQKYFCPSCRANVWAKKGLDIVCYQCCQKHHGNLDKSMFQPAPHLVSAGV
jgi:hypothetical protein